MPTSRIDIMTNDIKVFLLNRSFSITCLLLEFFIKMETNPSFESQMWYSDLELTTWDIAKYLYVEDELKRLTKNVCGKLTSSG